MKEIKTVCINTLFLIGSKYCIKDKHNFRASGYKKKKKDKSNKNLQGGEQGFIFFLRCFKGTQLEQPDSNLV